MMEKWIVVTTISLPTGDIEKLAAIDGWQLLVVGDSKTPSNWNYPGSIFVGTEDQQQLRYNILQHLPFDSYTRKNIGYLYAIEHGAKYIYDTDDDNHPTDNLTHFKKSSYTTGIIFNSNNRLVVNPYAHFGQPSIWPRGYPLDRVAESSTNTYISCQFRTPPVQQGLVNGDPDVDAIFRLTRKKVGMELNLTFDVHAPPVIVPAGIFAPYNSQNTFHSYRGLWALLLPTVALRVTDIWRGYWAQRLLWLIGDVVAFHPPNAYQKRNSHSYLKDFLEEETVYEDSGKLVHYLSNWNCKSPMTFFQCVSKLSHDLAEEGFWKKADADLTDAWLIDLVQVGYKEPVIVNYDLNSKTITSCVNANPHNELLFFPVAQTTSYMAPSVYESQSLQLKLHAILSLCPALASQLPEKDPSYTFSNTLLILVFNNPYLQFVRLLDEIFSHHFPNMIYCVNINSTDWSSIHIFNINNPESKSRRISFINSTLSSGYFAYECTVQAIEMGYNVNGYFVVGDDVLFNYWNLKTFDMDQVLLEGYAYATRSRYSNETNWMWWVDDEMGKLPTNAFLDEISELDSNLKSSSFKDNVNEGRNLAIEQYIKNRYIKGFNMTTVSFVLSDIYYVPNHVSNIFYHIASIFRKHNVFLEIAVATTLDGLLPIPWADLHGGSLWDDDRSFPMDYYNSSKTNLHPVKLGLLENDANLTAEFCQKYIADLFKNW